MKYPLTNIMCRLPFILACSLLFFFPACYNFETEPYEWNSEDKVLSLQDSTENSAIKKLFYATYLDLPLLHIRLQSSSSYLDAATDDGVPTKSVGGNGSLDNYRNGLLSPGNIADLDGDAWDRNYSGIRRVNLFLEKIQLFPASTQLPVERIVRMKAEARLLRAYYYFELMKRWGGVPMLGDQVLDVNSDVHIPRSTIDEVSNYIISEISPDVTACPNSCFPDLHAAQSTASEDPTEIGHVNQGVALALLSRLKLYLASPLYNPSNNPDKWRDAANAADTLIKLGVYELYTGADMTKLFAMNASDFPHKEMIMIKEMGSNSAIEQKNSPSGYTYGTASGAQSTVRSEGATSPSQNLVDAFLMIDGRSIFVDYDPEKGIDPSVNYNPQNPYTNRDPRLARTVFHHNQRWLKRMIEVYDGGQDRGAVKGAVYTQTGYYLRKFLGDNTSTESYTALYHHYQIFRYAEILLNYAEAVNEYDPGNDAEITKGLIALRKRAGIRAGADARYGLPATYTQDLMRRIIRNERRIELAFEDHRFWDIRRWKICDEGDAVMTKPVRGVRITRDGTRFTYDYVDVRNSRFASHMYWYPIPRSEMQGNTNLVQNPGWNY
ncbi:MAG: RagB/SusD family nutrient uptake outer membrane protein [Dysgonamonadaceae bacterium]|nr:RagB/SusD family nutrient uptake outer membrane protein [Dysgonamonadaceae bacterium]